MLFSAFDFPAFPGLCRVSMASQVEEFIEENFLEPGAADRLREEPWPVQAKVIAEGPVTGNNITAVLISRIKRRGASGGGLLRAPARARPTSLALLWAMTLRMLHPVAKHMS